MLGIVLLQAWGWTGDLQISLHQHFSDSASLLAPAMNYPLLSATQSLQSSQKHERGTQIAMSLIGALRIRHFISLSGCNTAQQEQNSVEKYWRGMKNEKTCFLWWPQMDQAELRRVWEMKGRGRAGRKVREREGEQGQRCGQQLHCSMLLATSEEAGGMVSTPTNSWD